MSYIVKCEKCPFDTYAQKRENAKAIAAIHVQDCLSDTGMEDIYIGGGLHKFGHLGWVNLEYFTDALRYEMGQANEGMKTWEKALKDLDSRFSFPDEDELKSFDAWINDSLFMNLVEAARKHA